MVPLKPLAQRPAHGGGIAVLEVGSPLPLASSPSRYYLWQSQAAPWGPSELPAPQAPDYTGFSHSCITTAHLLLRRAPRSCSVTVVYLQCPVDKIC